MFAHTMLWLEFESGGWTIAFLPIQNNSVYFQSFLGQTLIDGRYQYALVQIVRG